MVMVFALGCGRTDDGPGPTLSQAARPSILLVTLDTTRADAIGPEAVGIETPIFNALAARGRRFSRAYTTVPETLPSHTSMMTGLYPAGHGIHENARTLAKETPVLAERLRQAGYRTAAFVSSFVLARRFGLSRGFDLYDDVDVPERTSKATTDRALEYLRGTSDKPRLVWVHYFDPHAPYAPEEPYRSRYAKNPYLGEVAAVDEQLGRLVEAFERSAGGPVAIVVVGDHGEGLGEHGESQHGNLLYDATMHVPLVMVGPGVPAAAESAPVSTRRVYHTILDFAGVDAAQSLRASGPSEIVLGEAMKPFLEYGWQPQVMAVEGSTKVIFAGRNEAYDLAADPKESRDVSASAPLSRAQRTALKDYPVPSPAAARGPASLSEEDQKKLASLGYVSAGAVPVIRKNAPRPVDMARLFDPIEKASGLFVASEYAKVIPLLEQIIAEDPFNLDAVLRLATAHSALGHDARALGMFARARDLAPQSEDVRVYYALHLARGARWEEAVPLLEKITAGSPEKLPALEALARLRERQGRMREALATWQQIHVLRQASPLELAKVGELAMAVEDTSTAIRAFEEERGAEGAAFRHNLELGVLYLASRRFADARDALDRVSPKHPAYAMALFKRAQVSVLLREPDRAARIEAARRGADATTGELIAKERLFQGDQR
jgi:arylsulfatase A-like enzyme/Tfp pilus assembly protein PilF